MFNLEQSIAAWRQQMLAAGIQSPASLDELEVHLREEIERQLRSDLDGPQSFHAAVEIIGRAAPLGAEYQKVGGFPGAHPVKWLGLACAGIAGLFTAWTLLILLTAHEPNWTARLSGLPAIAAIIVTWRQGGKWLPTIRHPWLRPCTGVLCCFASLGGMKLLVTTVVPHYLECAAGANLPAGPMLAAFTWTWAAATIFGIIAYKLQVTADKNEPRHV
jgi:hypothetical protein